jgi:hypothetical protein
LKDFEEWKHLTAANRDDTDSDDEEIPNAWSDIKKLDNPEKELEDEELAIDARLAAQALLREEKLESKDPLGLERVVIKKSMKKMGAASLWRKLKGKKPAATATQDKKEKTLSDEIIQTVLFFSSANFCVNVAAHQ